jgi:SET domain-containing protein
MRHDETEEAIEVRASGVHGRGVFATRRLGAGEAIGTYRGRRLAEAEVAGEWDHSLTYVFGLSDGSIIDGSEGGNATRHLNHSCAPNCVAWEVDGDDGRPQVVIEALRDIDAGEELFIDYALDVGDADRADYACRCGAPACRGSMAG